MLAGWLALCWLASSGCLSRSTDVEEGTGHQAAAGAGEIVYWTCPMHPSVKAARPGSCPMCSMKLTPVTREELEHGIVVVDSLRRQRFGVRTSTAEVRELVHEIHVRGTVAWDESRLYDVTMRAQGWVERMFVSETGVAIERGQPLARIYSTDMYGAQRELLASRGSAREVSELDQLKLLGLTRWQIDKVLAAGEPSETFTLLAPKSGIVLELDEVVEGTFLPAGKRFARIGRLDSVRVEADVHEDDIGLVQPGASVSIEVPGSRTRMAGTVDQIVPWVDPNTRRATVRIALQPREQAKTDDETHDDNGSASQLLPGMYVPVTLEVRPGPTLTVPRESVIVSGRRRIVFVDQGDDRLVPQEVTVGRSNEEWMEIVDGLEPGTPVISSGVFLIAAESRLRAATAYWGAKQEEDRGKGPDQDRGKGQRQDRGKGPDRGGHESHAH